MITYYNRKDLVSFGNYLLSETRRDLFASHTEFGEKRLEERLSYVHDSDIENWKIEATTKKLSNHYKPSIEHEE